MRLKTCHDLHCAAAGDVNANDVIVTSEGLCVIDYWLCVDLYVHVQCVSLRPLGQLFQHNLHP